MFDAEALMNSVTNDAGDTRYPTIPDGEFMAVIKSVDKPREAKGNVILDVTWMIDDETVRTATGLKEPTCRQSIFLDITPSGTLDLGPYKNTQLNRLREAVGMNTPGTPFSFPMMQGRVAKVRVKQRIADGETYSDVKGVVKAA